MDQKSLLFTPEGVRDIYGEDCERRAKIQQGIHTIMKQYGFKNIQTPTFEFFDIFNRERGTVKSADMFKFFGRKAVIAVKRLYSFVKSCTLFVVFAHARPSSQSL